MQEKKKKGEKVEVRQIYYPSVLSSVCQTVTLQEIYTSKLYRLCDLFEELQLLNEETRSTRI